MPACHREIGGQLDNAGKACLAPYLNTALGVLGYAELAPHLATRVQALQSPIAAGQ